MHVLISGGGIAGLTLGLCLHRAAIHCTIVEKSPAARSAGYMVDFFGSGYDAAERLGLLPDLARIHYPIARLAFLDGRGNVKFAVPYPVLRKLFDDRHFNFMRGDLEQVLLSKLGGAVEVRYGVTIDSFDQDGDGVSASMSDGSTLRADVLAGADGIHSKVRVLAFGPEERFTRFLGCNTAAFILQDRTIDLGSTEAFDTLTVPGRQVAVYPICGNRLATFLIHTAQNPPSDTIDPLGELRRVYGNMGWIVPRLLESVAPEDIYFDAVSQIEMPQWSTGRVVLTGDASWCVSLVAGQGASLAMAGSYILAEELSAARSDVVGAFRRYEQRLRPDITEKQLAGQKMAKWFVPENRLRLAIRDTMMRFVGFRGANRMLKGLFATRSVFAT